MSTAAGRTRELHRTRIDAAMEVLSELFSRENVSREEARRLLEESYRRRALQPIRGKAWPPDIWDKEIATLYAIAKYALMLNEEDEERFSKLFGYEETLEDAAEILLEKPPEEARRLVLFLLGGSIDDNTIARLLRVETTKMLLGFSDEDRVIELLKRLAEAFPEYSQTVRKYARYFIALRVAEAIASGEARSRIAKEALKQALAARIGLEKIMPDDEYIEFIATTVFSVPKRRAERLLGGEKRKRKGERRSRGSAAGSQPIPPGGEAEG